MSSCPSKHDFRNSPGMADDVELFNFSPAKLASQKSEFFEEVYFRCRTHNGGLQFGFKHGGRVIVPVSLEFTDSRSYISMHLSMATADGSNCEPGSS